MNVVISNADPAPIYEQICTQIKNEILNGAAKEGDALPSIRALAKDLRISVITTKRAYDELEREGFVYKVAAKGCYVAGINTNLLRESRLKQAEEHIREAVRIASPLKISLTELSDLLDTIFTEENIDNERN